MAPRLTEFSLALLFCFSLRANTSHHSASARLGGVAGVVPAIHVRTASPEAALLSVGARQTSQRRRYKRQDLAFSRRASVRVSADT
ncbi:hypothetical protein V5799_004036 [Amblyomma americanum]|uniref:Secreted protein n=1 Tax=Amblyomma americanum TaxID=6943 RepID=A0AAQ4D7A3_AMBAM